MSSDWAPSRLGRICTVLILVSVAIHPACGRKEDPEPPPRKNPAATRDLKIAQRGMELILTFSYPTMTMGGIGLVGGVDRIEIDGFVRAAPEFMEQPTVEGEELEGELATDDEPDTVGIASEVEGSGEPGTEETPETSPEAPQPEASAEPMVRERPEQEPEVTDRPEMTQEERQRAREARAGEAQERAQAAERDEIEREEQGVEEEAKAEAAIGEAEAVDQTEEMEELAESEDSADPFDAPEPNPFLQIRMDADEFRKEANRIMVLEEEALTSAIIGGQVVVRLPLSEVPTEPPVAHGYQLRTYSRRLESPDSNLAAFVPLPPPDSPQDLTLTPSAGGVTVAWAPLEDEEEIEGYNVYRRLAQSRYYDRAISMTEPGQSEFLDRSPQYGNSYIYSVTAVRMRNPLVESATGREREITFRDDFPPPPPRELVVLAEVGRVRLVWQASQAKDVVSYLVFARQGDGEPKLLTPDPLATAEFRHEGVISGTTYTYFVVAVDSKGNRSEPSEETSTRAP